MSVEEIIQREIKYEKSRMEQLRKDYEDGKVDYVTYQVLSAYHEGALIVCDRIMEGILW